MILYQYKPPGNSYGISMSRGARTLPSDRPCRFWSPRPGNIGQPASWPSLIPKMLGNQGESTFFWSKNDDLMERNVGIWWDKTSDKSKKWWFCRGHGTMMPWPSSMDETHLKLLQKQLVTSYNRWKYTCFLCIIWLRYCKNLYITQFNMQLSCHHNSVA